MSTFFDPNQAGIYPLTSPDVDALFAAATARPYNARDTRSQGRLWLDLPQPLHRRIKERAGTDPRVTWLVEIPVEGPLRSVVGGMIYGLSVKLDDTYYCQLTENGNLVAKYQFILGSRHCARVHPEHIERLVEAVAQAICQREGRELPAATPAAQAVQNVPAAAAKASDPGLLAQISALTADAAERRLLLPTQHLSRYAEIKRLLETAGGKYNRKGYFQFAVGMDVADILSQLQGGESVNSKKDAQFFATPPARAAALVETLGPLEGKRVCEPSAGDGALLVELQKRGAAEVVAIENWDVNVAALRAKGFDPLARDFLTVTPEEVGFFDAIAMNPPFTKLQDVAHVAHAMTLLQPDGKLAAIMSPAVNFHTTKKARSFREFLEFVGIEPKDLPAGEFRESGTDVTTVQIELDMAVVLQRFIESGRSPEEFGLTLPHFNGAEERQAERGERPGR